MGVQPVIKGTEITRTLISPHIEIIIHHFTRRLFWAFGWVHVAFQLG